MGSQGPRIFQTVAIIIMFVDFTITVPVPAASPARRAPHSFDQLEMKSWTSDSASNLLIPTQNETTVLSQREHNTGDGAFSTDDGDGSTEVHEGGTFNNDSRTSSRFSQNETEPCSLEPAILCSSADPAYSNRDRHRRIVHIVNYLWTNVFKNRTTMVNKETTPHYNPLNSGSKFSGGLETILASCDLPSEVEGEAWSSESHFSLFFNLTSKYPELVALPEITRRNTSSEPRQQQQNENVSNESGYSQEYLPIGTQPLFTTLTVTPKRSINIISAKLRLYKIGSGATENSLTLATNLRTNSEPCNDTEILPSGSDEEMMPSTFSTKRASFSEYSPTVDEKIRVSVFWYTQPAIKNHYKKKLVDAKMISVQENGWIEFDIKNAATAWLNERKPNYGLVIEVENENQDSLNPRLYFGDAPCLQSQSDEVVKLQSSLGTNQESGSGTPSPLSPFIEICILNIPQATTPFEQPRYLPSALSSFNHLQRIADMHAKSNNSNSAFSRPRLDNINLRAFSPEVFAAATANGNENESNSIPTQTIIVPNHRHRHHHHVTMEGDSPQTDTAGSGRHNRRKANPIGSTQQYTLEYDHPLRQILASVNANANSRESNKRAFTSPSMHAVGKRLPSHLIPEMPADEGWNGGDYSDSSEQDAVITKIIISPGQFHRKPSHARGLPNVSSTSASVPQLSWILPTDSTKTLNRSSER